MTPEPIADDRPPVAAGYRRRFHSSRDMQALLDRERMRADRNGHRLAVAVFDPAPDCSRADARRFHAAIRAALLSHTRATDDVGWYSRRAAAAIMPFTEPDQARAMTARIRDDLGDLGRLCVVHLHTYHHDDREHDDDRDRHDRGFAIDDAPPSPAAAESPQSLAPAARSITIDRETRGAEWCFVEPSPLWKRAMDVAGAAVGLVVFAPLMLVVASAVKLTSPGPVLFRQQRTGLYGRPFTILKFRTMVVGAESLKPAVAHLNEQDGPTFKVRHDPRVTPLGRLLRRTCVDELPQLFNVLLGQMSLVGPRPLDVNEAAHCTHWHRQRLDVLPGMTCIWQVSGRPRHCFDEWARMDIRYARTRSLWLDATLLARTLPVVLFNQDAPW